MVESARRMGKNLDEDEVKCLNVEFQLRRQRCRKMLSEERRKSAR